MIKTQYILTAFVLLFQLAALSQEQLEVGIFRSLKSLKSIDFKPSNNSYQVFDENDSLIYHLQKGEKLTVRISSNGEDVKLKVPDEDLGYFKSVRIIPTNSESTFNIIATSPASRSRDYYDGLKCEMFEGRFNVVSLVSMSHYLIGVIESESGNYQGTEYYKVQAIISRTYALKNKTKFRHEGFMLTDLVNCQVYLGKMYKNPKMLAAVQETEGMILVDHDMNYISAAFYSNSGGQTANSEDVWSKEVSYLRSLSDPFSKGKHNYYWTKSFSKSDFLHKLKHNYDFPIDDEQAVNAALNFKQDYRAKYFIDWKYHILLTDMRTDFKLKSTFFTIEATGDKVTLMGKGFGHGVGLSQEGAMNMCDAGYSYKDVLAFYYTNVHLINQMDMDFFQAD
jgi:stage II sporulation protein D